MVVMGTFVIDSETLYVLKSPEKIKACMKNKYVLNISNDLMKEIMQIIIKKHKFLDNGILISDNMIHLTSRETLYELFLVCNRLTKEQLLAFLTELHDCGKEAVHKIFDIWRASKRFGELCDYAVRKREAMIIYID
ncbi:hypothetical protein [[Eubacterium] hominis]|uniref:hypothetical protein n=1 Tax=[Eubacterium] hominis TaxID=2764325 RepID=UPI003A4DF146